MIKIEGWSTWTVYTKQCDEQVNDNMIMFKLETEDVEPNRYLLRLRYALWKRNSRKELISFLKFSTKKNNCCYKVG
jgi:hypothetical protein